MQFISTREWILFLSGALFQASVCSGRGPALSSRRDSSGSDSIYLVSLVQIESLVCHWEKKGLSSFSLLCWLKRLVYKLIFVLFKLDDDDGDDDMQIYSKPSEYWTWHLIEWRLLMKDMLLSWIASVKLPIHSSQRRLCSSTTKKCRMTAE